MGYQLDDARTRNGQTIWVLCLQVASQKAMYINGGRYELFLRAKGKSTAAIEWVMVEAAKNKGTSKISAGVDRMETQTVAATNQLCKQLSLIHI